MKRMNFIVQKKKPLGWTVLQCLILLLATAVVTSRVYSASLHHGVQSYADSREVK